MHKTFLKYEKPLLTVMVKNVIPDKAVKEMKTALENGAEAFGIQAENFPREYHTKADFRNIFAAAEDKPIYITNYRLVNNSELAYDELAEELVGFAKLGATLCDVPGDMFCKHPDELTDNSEAIEKQISLIERLHKVGAEVVMSSHVNRFIPAERVYEIAAEQQRRGADMVKIVTAADNMSEQIENLRITDELKRKISIPYLYLSGGSESRIHRRIGILMGCCMSLCVAEDNNPDNPQPYVADEKAVRDNLKFLGECNYESNIGK